MRHSASASGSFSVLGALGLAALTGAAHAQVPAGGTAVLEHQLVVGAQPTLVAVGDLNGDGLGDLAFTLVAEAAVHLSFNNGQGRLDPEPPLALSGVPSHLTAADANGDGLDDLVLCSEQGWLEVRAGQAAGGFPVALHLDGLGTPVQVSVADMTGDGQPDLITSNSAAGGDLLIFPGQGGSWGGAVVVPANGAAHWVELDLELDGDLDLALTSSGQSLVQLLSNPGNGQLQPAGVLFTNPSGVLVATDFTGEGRTDLVVGTKVNPGTGQSVVNFFTDSTSGFELTDSVGPFSQAAHSISASDLDGDGAGEVVVQVYPSAPDLPTGLGLFELDGAGVLAGSASLILADAFNVAGAALGDLDGDGHDDLLTLAPTGVSVQPGLGDGGFAEYAELPTGAGSLAWDAAVIDVDGDGLPDVVSVADTSSESVVETWLGEGNGLFATPISDGLGADLSTVRLVLTDLSGDGVPDLILNETDRVDLLTGDGSGHFLFAASVPDGPGAATSIATADLNDDGDADFLLDTIGTPSDFNIVFGHGASLGAAQAVTISDGTVSTGPALADMDADGDVDVVFTQSNLLGTLGVLPNNGDASFNFASYFGEDVFGSVELGDVDADGDLDAFTGPASGVLSLLLGNGQGGFADASTYAAPASPFVTLGVADLDADGCADAVIGTIERFDLLLADGTGRLGPASTYAGGSYRSVAVADVDLDGRSDLVSAFVGPPRVHLNRFEPAPWVQLGGGLPGDTLALLRGQGDATPGSPVALRVRSAPPFNQVYLVIGLDAQPLPFKGGVLWPDAQLLLSGLVTDAEGSLLLPATWPAGLPGGWLIVFQAWLPDASGPHGFSSTGGMALHVP